MMCKDGSRSVLLCLGFEMYEVADYTFVVAVSYFIFESSKGVLKVDGGSW